MAANPSTSGSGCVSVLVPTGGPDCPWRAKARTYVLDHYRREHPDWELIEGTCPEPWSKGAAVHDAYQQSAGQIVVLADADSFVPAEGLRAAVDSAQVRGWAMPHRIVFRLNREATEDVYNGGQPDLKRCCRDPYRGVKGGGIVAMTRAAYEKVGGIDPRFQGWGGEDISLGWALQCLVADPIRHNAPFIHLWHPHPAPDEHGNPETEVLAGRYRAANCDRPAMRALIAERS